MWPLRPITCPPAPTIQRAGPVDDVRIFFLGYGSDDRKCCMHASRARFLSSDFTMIQRGPAVSV